MRIAKTLALFVFIASIAHAQYLSSGPRDQPETSALVSAPSAVKPPRTPRVIDKKFVFIMSGLGGAESLRFTSRKLVLDHEYAAGAPWVRHVPADSDLVAKYSPLYSAELVAAFELKKPHSWLPGDRIIRKLWWIPPIGLSAIHFKNGIENIRTQGPGGCTSIACAEPPQ